MDMRGFKGFSNWQQINPSKNPWKQNPTKNLPKKWKLFYLFSLHGWLSSNVNLVVLADLAGDPHFKKSGKNLRSIKFAGPVCDTGLLSFVLIWSCQSWRGWFLTRSSGSQRGHSYRFRFERIERRKGGDRLPANLTVTMVKNDQQNQNFSLV